MDSQTYGVLIVLNILSAILLMFMFIFINTHMDLLIMYQIMSVLIFIFWLVSNIYMIKNSYRGSLFIRTFISILICCLIFISFFYQRLLFSSLFNIFFIILILNYCIYVYEFIHELIKQGNCGKK